MTRDPFWCNPLKKFSSRTLLAHKEQRKQYQGLSKTRLRGSLPNGDDCYNSDQYFQ